MAFEESALRVYVLSMIMRWPWLSSREEMDHSSLHSSLWLSSTGYVLKKYLYPCDSVYDSACNVVCDIVCDCIWDIEWDILCDIVCEYETSYETSYVTLYVTSYVIVPDVLASDMGPRPPLPHSSPHSYSSSLPWRTPEGSRYNSLHYKFNWIISIRTLALVRAGTTRLVD